MVLHFDSWNIKTNIISKKEKNTLGLSFFFNRSSKFLLFLNSEQWTDTVGWSHENIATNGGSIGELKVPQATQPATCLCSWIFNSKQKGNQIYFWNGRKNWDLIPEKTFQKKFMDFIYVSLITELLSTSIY